MYRSLGGSRADCAKHLHVTERCLRNREAGRHAIPFAAFRLLRISCYMELPGKDWDGWHLGAGKLWTPERRGLTRTMPIDGLTGKRIFGGVSAQGSGPFLKLILLHTMCIF